MTHKKRRGERDEAYLSGSVLSGAFTGRQLSLGLASLGTFLAYVLVGHGAVRVLV